MFKSNKALLAPNIYTSGFQLCSWQKDTMFSEEAIPNWTVFNFVSIEKNKVYCLCLFTLKYNCQYLFICDMDGNRDRSNPVTLSTEDNGIRTAAVSINGTTVH